MADRSKFISSEVSSQIKTLRLRKGMTQKELADYLYKGESTVRMWELGKSEPDIQAIIAMAELFSISTDTLLGHINLIASVRRLSCISAMSSTPVKLFLMKYGVDEDIAEKIASGKKLVPSEVANQISLDAKVPLEFIYGYKFKPITPVEQWSSDFRDEYNKAPELQREYILIRHGGYKFEYEKNSDDPQREALAVELTEQENALLAAFRGTTEEGRMKIIQAVLNICDEIERRQINGNNSHVAG